MKTDILNTLDFSRKLIISPDMDGFMSAKLLNRYNGSEVVGTYDKNILCLADGVDVAECIFVDCDLNHPNYVSIGNHMRLIGDSMSKRSFNPNVHFGVTEYTEKFPYATAFLISFATEVPTSLPDKIRMAYADSTLRNMEKYGDNMRNWSSRMSHDAVSYVLWNTEEIQNTDNEFREIYPNQSFTSKRFGKARYIDTLNLSLKVEDMAFKTLLTGTKYMTDKVGINTVKKYSHDILSYAEIFGGEYSVTYNQEVDWK